VWVRWATVGQHAGWYAIGTRKPQGERSFWEKTFALATSVGNGHLDAVHAIGPGILSVGGMGVTMASGMAQRLLRYALKREPIRWMECMAPLLADAGTLRVLGFTADDPLADLELVIRASKPQAKLWVECCSRLLRDARFESVQEEFLAGESHSVLGRLSMMLGFSEVHGYYRASEPVRWQIWDWSQEQMAVWALAIVMALSDARLTEELVAPALFGDAWKQHYPDAYGSAEATLLALYAQTKTMELHGAPAHFVAQALPDGPTPEQFISRLVRVVSLLSEYFAIPQWKKERS
jgi:hypothetical protein